MAVTKGSTSGVYGQKYISMLAGNAPFAPTDFDSIATFVATGSETGVTFSSIPATYTHLQIRLNTSTARYNSFSLICNGDTTANYSVHGMYRRENSTGGAFGVLAQTYYYLSYAANTPLTYPWVGLVDILEYTNTSKWKTMRTLCGGINNTTDGYNAVEQNSGMWQSLAAVNSITISGPTINSGSTISLYGIKG